MNAKRMSDAIWELGSIVDEAKETRGEVVLTAGNIQTVEDVINALERFNDQEVLR